MNNRFLAVQIVYTKILEEKKKNPTKAADNMNAGLRTGQSSREDVTV